MSQNKQHKRVAPVSLQQHHPYFYLSPAAARNLLQYEYKGIDHSLIYQYVLSPLAGVLVNRVTPVWLAPNVITLVGLLLMVLAYLLTAYYYTKKLPLNSSLTEPDDPEPFLAHHHRAAVPPWVFAINAAAMLIYQTLDNMDGKQARKTHSSSPLGLLFDHGCDAINSAMGSQMWIAAVGITLTTHPLAAFICLLGPMTLFYVSTWEEYHTHILILPIFNGPTEGLLLGAAIMIITFLDPHFWSHTSFWDHYAPNSLQNLFDKQPITHLDLLMGASILMTVREVTFKVVTVAYRHGLRSCLHLLPFVSLAVLTAIIGYTDPNLMERNFTIFLHLISALFVEMVTSMMLDHLTKQKYNILRWTLVPYFLLTALVLSHSSYSYSYSYSSSSHKQDLDTLVAVYTATLLVYLIFKIRIIIHEVTVILGIYCFDIQTPRGPDYSTVQTLLSIICLDDENNHHHHHHHNTMENHHEEDSMIHECTVDPAGGCTSQLQTGVPVYYYSMEKKEL